MSLDMWHVTPGTRYLGQYMCVATNSVTTTETVHNFTGTNGAKCRRSHTRTLMIYLGTARAPVITSQVEEVMLTEHSVAEHVLTWSTVTLYPIVEYIILTRRRPGQGWSRVLVPEVSLPRHNKVHGRFSLRLEATNYTLEVKLAAVNSLGQAGLWSKVHSVLVRFNTNLGKTQKIYNIRAKFYTFYL